VAVLEAQATLIRPTLACLGLILAGCAPAAAPPVGLGAYADEKEYLVPSTQGIVSRAQAASTGVTQYFQINAKRVCYSFQLPGTWEPMSEPGAARRLDGEGVVSAWVFNIAELGATSADGAIRKAAEQSGAVYAKERAGAPWTLTPYPPVPRAWSWLVPVTPTTSASAASIVPRWYVPAGDAWIAQFAIRVPPAMETDAFVTDVLTSLTTSREPRCYEARLRELGAVR
jgi:hypothetical protein